MEVEQRKLRHRLLSTGALGLAFVWRLDADEDLIPLVMFARWYRPAAFESAIKQLHFGDLVEVEPTPVWELATTRSVDLISKKFDHTVVDAVIVRFDNSFASTVKKLQHPHLVNCGSEQLVY